MAARHIYSQPVTDYNSSIPLKYEQKILETIFWSVVGGKAKEEIKSKCHFQEIPQIPEAVFQEMYDAVVETCKGFK